MAEEKNLPKINVNQLGPEELSKVAGGSFIVVGDQSGTVARCPYCGCIEFKNSSNVIWESIECTSCGETYFSMQSPEVTDPAGPNSPTF
jgi:hypothetical protein